MHNVHCNVHCTCLMFGLLLLVLYYFVLLVSIVTYIIQPTLARMMEEGSERGKVTSTVCPFGSRILAMALGHNLELQ